MKVVINGCYGGFGLSHEAVMRYAELKGIKLYPYIDEISRKVYKERATLDNPAILIHYTTVPQEEYEAVLREEEKKPVGVGRFEKSNALYFSDRDITRNDATLIQVVRELKGRANGKHAELQIADIPDGIEWEIDEYDGVEHIAEKHRTWS